MTRLSNGIANKASDGSNSKAPLPNRSDKDKKEDSSETKSIITTRSKATKHKKDHEEENNVRTKTTIAIGNLIDMTTDPTSTP
eukprot:719759-Ditylum_brightwellii.AAC.1